MRVGLQLLCLEAAMAVADLAFFVVGQRSQRGASHDTDKARNSDVIIYHTQMIIWHIRAVPAGRQLLFFLFIGRPTQNWIKLSRWRVSTICLDGKHIFCFRFRVPTQLTRIAGVSSPAPPLNPPLCCGQP